MKNLRLYTALFILLAFSQLSAQIESTHGKMLGLPIEKWVNLDVDENIIRQLSDIPPSKDGSMQFAFPVEVRLNPSNSGAWIKEGNENVWTIGITSKGAKSLNLILAPFKIPGNSYIYIYDEKKETILGAIGPENNNPDNVLPVMPVPGERIVLEYHLPAEEKWQGTLSISQVAHDYRGILGNDGKDNRFNLSQPCNEDINCTGGLQYQVVKRSVCRIIVGGIELCSGVLLNNTMQRNQALLATAQHCITDDGDAATSIFVFGYESPWCDGPDGRVIHSISGSQLKATNISTDFSLVELNTFPPFTYKPYFAGWDVTGAVPVSTVTIHHPMGDIKKISTDNNPPLSSTYTGYLVNGFWKVAQWETGTTEGGSSGAPLIDQNKRVVGLLTGGEAVCGRSVNDYFSKLSSSYDNSVVLWEQLKGWIDPGKTGLKTLDGRDPYSANNLTVDTLSNMTSNETRYAVKYTAPGTGYITGFNSDSLVMYAEYFSNPGLKKLSEVFINLSKVNWVSSADTARVFIFSGGASPGTVLASQKVYLNEAKDTFRLQVDFKTVVNTGSSFYVGWRIRYKDPAATEVRQFAPFHSADRVSPALCTAWFNDGVQWQKFTQHPFAPQSVALDVRAVVVGDPVYNSSELLQEADEKFRVYPNPASSRLFVSSELSEKAVEVSLYDSRGLKVRSEWSEGLFPGKKEININDLPQGLYFVVIRYGRTGEVHKLIKTR